MSTNKDVKHNSTDEFDIAVAELYDELKYSWASKEISQELLVELMGVIIVAVENRYSKGKFKHELVLAILKKVVVDEVSSEELQKGLLIFIDGPLSIMISQACKFAKNSFKGFTWKRFCQKCCSCGK
jgi:hypothetical protein